MPQRRRQPGQRPVPRGGFPTVVRIPVSQPSSSDSPSPDPEPPQPNPMSDEVTFVLETLLRNGGSLPLSRLSEQYLEFVSDGGRRNKKDQRCLRLVQRWPGLFQVGPEPDATVSACVDVKVCQAYTTKGVGCAGSCADLHICKFFLQGGSCRFGDACHFGHDLQSPHNQRVLDAKQLGDLSYDLLRVAMSRSKSGGQVPQICKFYNTSGCKHESTSRGMTCPALHVCLHYVKGDCSFGPNRCKRSHNILGEQGVMLLQKYGVNIQRHPNEVLQTVREAIMDSNVPTSGLARHSSQGRFSSTGNLGSLGNPGRSRPGLTQSFGNLSMAGEGLRLPSSPPSRGMSRPSPRSRGSSMSSTNSLDDLDDNTPAVCLYNLGGKCHYQARCRNEHADKPYLWQYQLADKSWASFPAQSNKEIELNFCDVSKEVCMSTDPNNPSNPVKLNFETMKVDWNNGRQSSVRRLSTVSDRKNPTAKFATKWGWFWQDEHSQWQPYKQSAGGVQQSNVDTCVLEESYLLNPEGTYCFATLSNEYMIKFKIMKQRNIKTGVERPVRRRPFWDALAKQKEEPGAVPPNWDMSAGDKSDFRRVEIFPTGPQAAEYQNVVVQMKKTLPSIRIRKIERVQNQMLWEGYQWKKTWMRQKNDDGSEPEEKLLFHGTTKDIDAICQQGFDWRLAGTSVGTRFGKGSYFARDAEYSYRLTGCKEMFLVRVLVGSSTVGQPSYTRPPPKNLQNQSILYDSCVDNMGNPSMYVVFEHQQSYPEYIISYDV